MPMPVYSQGNDYAEQEIVDCRRRQHMLNGTATFQLHGGYVHSDATSDGVSVQLVSLASWAWLLYATSKQTFSAF